VTGLQTPRTVEEALAEVFQTTQDGKSCYWALKELRAFRIVSKEKWQEWSKLVRSRFKEEEGSEEEDTEDLPRLRLKETVRVLMSFPEES
jgi:hypothetical protein